MAWRVTIDVDGKVVATECIMDQFQWDVELEAGIFEPNIPPDYKQLKL